MYGAARQRRKEQGLCLQCGNVEALPSKLRCGECSDILSTKAKELRIRRRENNLCTQCGETKDGSLAVFCDACREKKYKRYSDTLARSTCPRCGETNDTSITECSSCSAKRSKERKEKVNQGLCSSCLSDPTLCSCKIDARSLYVERIDKNLCVECSNTPATHGRYCLRHYLRQLATSASKRARKKKLEVMSLEKFAEELLSIYSENMVCLYCGTGMRNAKGQPAPSSYSLDRIYPSRGYIEGNIQIICYACNMKKHELDATDPFFVQIIREQITEPLFPINS